MKTYIQSITLQGFRAYLQEQNIELPNGQSISIFAANAKGKSSLVDAVEFYFSAGGTLQRLGLRRSETQSGPEALEHVLAQEKNIAPLVTMKFQRGKEVIGEARKVSRPPSALTKSAAEILGLRKHDFIIRGHELRQFVEGRSAEDRYKDVSAWFGLTPLLTVQKNLRALRRRMKDKAESNTALDLRLGDLRKATNAGITSWTEAEVVKWLNANALHPLDKALNLSNVSIGDPVYAIVKKRKEEEADSLGLTALNKLTEAANSLYAMSEGKETGALIDFESAHDAHAIARDAETKERASAEKAAFNDVWISAQALFADDKVEIVECPICETSLAGSAQGSRAAVALHVQANLTALQEYNNALKALTAAGQLTNKTLAALKSAAHMLLTLLKAGKLKAGEDAMTPYVVAVDTWKLGDPVPASKGLRETVLKIATDAAAKAAEIQKHQGQHTYAGALAKIDGLIQVKKDIELAQQEKKELQKLNAKLDEIALGIDREIADHVASLIKVLKDEINNLYSKIQGPSGTAPSIRIDPPDPEDKGQLKLHLVVDFAPNREGVVPGGYLSDSQVHTLALSLRLAALKLFNKDVPIAVLDDVVTSYDADHRKAIAAVIAEEFPDFQFIIATHDERFFNYLKEHLPPAQWIHRQITHIEDEFGPRYTHHRITDDLIEEKLKKGDQASNEIRRAEEEWLLAKAREFGVDLRIRDIDKPYAYDRGELAASLASFLRAKKIKTPDIAGLKNPFWDSLQKGTVENFGSHFQDNPGASWSGGDEKKRWAEFKSFRDLFICPSCGHTKFKRPKVGVVNPLCFKCETPFSFKLPTAP